MTESKNSPQKSNFSHHFIPHTDGQSGKVLQSTKYSLFNQSEISGLQNCFVEYET